jgi:hypothetical protein
MAANSDLTGVEGLPRDSMVAHHHHSNTVHHNIITRTKEVMGMITTTEALDKNMQDNVKIMVMAEGHHHRTRMDMVDTRCLVLVEDLFLVLRQLIRIAANSVAHHQIEACQMGIMCKVLCAQHRLLPTRTLQVSLQPVLSSCSTDHVT